MFNLGEKEEREKKKGSAINWHSCVRCGELGGEEEKTVTQRGRKIRWARKLKKKKKAPKDRRERRVPTGPLRKRTYGFPE